MLNDREGNLWIGTRRHGLYRLKQRPISTISLSYEPGLKNISNIYQAPDSSIWMLSEKGIIQWSGHDIAAYSVASLWGHSMRAIWFDQGFDLFQLNG